MSIVKNLVARHDALKDAWWKQAASVIKEDQDYKEGELYRLRERIRAVQFQILLHTPCRQFARLERHFW